jgi:hypothetical protein
LQGGGEQQEVSLQREQQRQAALQAQRQHREQRKQQIDLLRGGPTDDSQSEGSQTVQGQHAAGGRTLTAQPAAPRGEKRGAQQGADSAAKKARKEKQQQQQQQQQPVQKQKQKQKRKHRQHHTYKQHHIVGMQHLPKKLLKRLQQGSKLL